MDSLLLGGKFQGINKIDDNKYFAIDNYGNKRIIKKINHDNLKQVIVLKESNVKN
jgi:hypothetical protein